MPAVPAVIIIVCLLLLCRENYVQLFFVYLNSMLIILLNTRIAVLYFIEALYYKARKVCYSKSRNNPKD